ncbi:sulfotransferase domain-containing protein [Salinibacter ruber]|uniref:sulfotransferase domain-containing protein n=1 Tax=Salinibacter ruber TaxID=146919 RepID=UPI0021675E35|nr:sulfotransferase domain-containing protein [Salinibacter ruber]
MPHPLRVSFPEYLDYISSLFITARSSTVITGYWRSGTTWVQQVISHSLQARRIFEPLYPKIIRYSRLRPTYVSKIGGERPLDAAWMPFSKGNLPVSFQKYLRDCLTGRICLTHQSGIKGYWLRSARNTQWEALQPRVVVKFVRGQLMLPGLLSTFDVPILHLRRDPRAVLASFKRKGWVDWFRCDTPLQHLLLRGGDGREEYFGQWRNDIEQIDHAGSAFGQAAAYWVLTERYVDEVPAENENVRIVRFQRLKEERNSYLLDVLDALGVEGAEPVPEDIFEKRSMTAQESTEDAQVQGNSGWEDTLTTSEVNEIDHALDVFDFTSSAYTE